VWLAGWLVGEAFVGVLLAYLIAGTHRLTVTTEGLVRQQQAFGMGLTWNYDAEHVSALRTGSDGGEDHERSTIDFEYGRVPVSIKVDLEPAETARVVEAVLEVLPEYGTGSVEEPSSTTAQASAEPPQTAGSPA
jgi:hypothetical protein